MTNTNNTINNPLNHTFKNKSFDKMVKRSIRLACEFIDDEKDRKALERNVLETYVVNINQLIAKLLDNKSVTAAEFEELTKSFMTEYL